MYVPDHYRPSDNDVRELLRNHGAVDLITNTVDGLRATMLPMIWIEPDGTAENGALGRLLGHVARKNDHWRERAQGDALAIVRGESDGYISPSWYATKREHGRVVPTWNYVVAHVRGQLVVHDDPAWVNDNVRLLTAKHEHNRQPGWSVDDAPAAYISGQLRAIVGVELLISSIESKFKLGQNRSEEDVAGAADGLELEGRHELAARMRAARERIASR